MIVELLIYISTLILLYLVGRVYNRYILKNIFYKYDFNQFENVVLNLALGVFSVVISTAVLFSSFSSIYLILFIALFSPIFILRNKEIGTLKDGERLKIKHLCFFLIAVLFFIYHQALFASVTNIPFYDFLYLSKISSGIINNGVESAYSSNSGYYGVDLNPHLYHYFECWFTGVISKVSNYSEYKILLFVTFPIFHLLVYLVLFLIVKTIFKSFYLCVFLAFGFLFGIKIFLNFEGGFLELSKMYRGLPYSLLFKLVSIYLFMLLSYFFYLKKIYWLVIFSICSLLIIYPSTIPSLSFFAFVLFIYTYIKSKIISPFSVSVFFVIIYLLLYQKIMSFDKMAGLLFHHYTLKQYVVLFSESIIKVFIEHYMTVALILIVSIKYFKLLIKNNLIIYLIVTLIGSMIYVYFNPPGVRDINQIINNISPVILLILTIELFQYLRNKKLINFFVFFMMIVGCYNVYINLKHPYYKLKGKETNQTKAFILSLEEVVNKDRGAMFSSISVNQPYHYYYHSEMKFNYLLKSKDIITPLEISILFDDNESIIRYKERNKYYPPNAYFSAHNNSDVNIFNYLKSQNIKYLLVEKTNISRVIAFLQHYSTLVLEDGNSLDRLYKLN